MAQTNEERTRNGPSRVVTERRTDESAIQCSMIRAGSASLGRVCSDFVRQLSSWPLVAVIGAAPVAHAQLGEPDETRRPFSIYATETASSLAERAKIHLAAGRHADAIADLQVLLEEHPGEVLPATRPLHKGRRSEGDVHRGAADHARRELLRLPEEARALYRDRFELRAQAALEAARATGDRRTLTDVARRWPLTVAAQRAWWALGDLELEIGNRVEALRAWERAVALHHGQLALELPTAEDWSRLASDAANSPDAGLRSRLELGAKLAAGSPTGARDLRDEAPCLLGGGLGPTPERGSLDGFAPPGRGADGWRDAFRLPKHPFDVPDGLFSLFPARWEDSLFVSTTLELFAINAFTGELAWRSGEPSGWEHIGQLQRDDFFDAVETAGSLITPAVSQGIAVCALQIPHSFEKKTDYGDMSIIKQLPNRRLYAFDARTGEELWNTEPPPDWDGESGDFGDRMRIVGSPVVSGSRVLVPAARLRGRIECHVGCFDLFTGELLWSTAVITGQRERNMFGRAVREFAAPPLVVAGGQVIAQTQLGTVAALNLFTGDLLWEVLYEKIPLRAAHNFNAPQRTSYWRSAPPVVVGETIVATPDDSEFMIAIDRSSGALIWSLRHDKIGQLAYSDTYFDVLVGADETGVYVGGRRVMAIDFPLGIATGEQIPQRRWVWPASRGTNLPSRTPRPVMTADRVWIPDRDTLVGIERRTGKQIESLTFPSGNVHIGEGLVFSLISDRLYGSFEWSGLLERARRRLAAAPDDLGETLALAQLLEKRGRTEAAQGRYDSSSQHLAEARRVIEEFTSGDVSEAHPRLRARLHAVLRAEAETLRARGDGDAALARLARARELAPGPAALRDTLLQELELFAPRNEAAWLATLDRLERECGDLGVRVSAPHGLDTAVRTSSFGPSPSEAEPLDEETSFELPMELWTAVTRVLRLDARGPGATVFADLHAILAGYGHRHFDDWDVGGWARERIGDRLARGQRDGYQAYEERARTLFERATQERDSELLERISELYPHSRAAHEASDTRLELAFLGGEASVVSRIVLGELGESWSLPECSPRDALRLVRLAEVLGNPELRAGLLAALAERHGQLASDLARHDGKTLRQLAAEFALAEAPLPAGATARFDENASLAKGLSLKGSFVPLGELPARANSWPAGAGHVTLFADEDRLVALSTIEEGAPEPASPKRWERLLRERETPDHWAWRFASSAGRAHLATYERILTLDRDKGDALWSWSERGTLPERIRAEDGVVVVTLRSDGSNRTERKRWILGLDAANGIELWRRELDTKRYTPRPALGGGRLCLLPDYPAERGLVLDLFTGHVQAHLSIEKMIQVVSDAAWIEGERLIVPRFVETQSPEHNHVSAYDLRDGSLVWRVDLGRLHGGAQLTHLLRYAGETFLVLESLDRGNGAPGGIYALDTERGLAAATPLATFSSSDHWLGVRIKDRTELDSPYVFQLTQPSPAHPLHLRAIHLPYGPRWEVPLRLEENELYHLTFPRPALSTSVAVVGWRAAKPGSRTRRTETIVTLVDRTSGQLRGVRTLHPDMDGSRTLQLVPLGDALVVCGSHRMEVWR